MKVWVFTFANSMINRNYSSQTVKEDFFLLLAGAFLLLNLIRGLRTGNASILYSMAKRSEDPVLFWCGICLSGVCAVLCFVVLIFF
ncbi:hypothetical protein DWU99_10630 [Dyella psychrodurans]|uniref:Uncharacterized protein n=1 Tax=Dyella psychrodurans TaxID=1927960 RepID=A0A370X6X9_9GAMM|nr:hypothetical protein DWU99_10630 [Dyella psychrodurans]